MLSVQCFKNMLPIISCLLVSPRPKKGGPPTGPRLIKHAQVPQEPYDGGKPTTCCGAHAAVAAAQADE